MVKKHNKNSFSEISIRPAKQSHKHAEKIKILWKLLPLLVLLAVVICVRIRLLDFPLERDEGEYAYAGQLILQGIPPYTMVISSLGDLGEGVLLSQGH